MILVAGLAIAGLAGIAAAFYFSMRPRTSRVRAASPARSPRADRPTRPDWPARADAPAGSRSRRAADRAAASTVIDLTGPQPALEDAEPMSAGRRARHGDRSHDTLVTPVTPPPGRRVAARHQAEADPEETDDAARAGRSRRRVGWRKGSEVDEEMWPVEAFGGVSDEQFWDDLASDKPLATTARAAQPEATARRRTPNAGPLPDLYPADGRGREDRRRAATESPGTDPQPRLGPDDRTAVQPAYAAPHAPATQPVRAVLPLHATQPVPATQPVRAAQAPVQTPQPIRAAQAPGGSRGRSRAAISPDEDPLTSPAYSLRAKGSVDGRSRRPDPDGYRSDGYRADPLRSDQLRSDQLRSDSLRSANGYDSSAGHPYPRQAYSESAPPASTQPYGDRRPSGNPGGQSYPGAQPHPTGQSYPNGQSYAGGQPYTGGDSRRANGGWNPGRANGSGAGDAGRTSQPGCPPVNGRRDPYDPRGYDRRLTTAR